MRRCWGKSVRNFPQRTIIVMLSVKYSSIPILQVFKKQWSNFEDDWATSTCVFYWASFGTSVETCTTVQINWMPYVRCFSILMVENRLNRLCTAVRCRCGGRSPSARSPSTRRGRETVGVRFPEAPARHRTLRRSSTRASTLSRQPAVRCARWEFAYEYSSSHR